LRVNAELLQRRRGRRSAHIEFEYSSHCHKGLRAVPILGLDVSKCLCAIDKQAATGPVVIFNNPIAPAVLTNQENRLPQARGRFAIVFH
jgi:hypothetical protein